MIENIFYFDCVGGVLCRDFLLSFFNGFGVLVFGGVLVVDLKVDVWVNLFEVWLLYI